VKLRALVALVLVVGCAKPVLRPLAWEPWTSYEPPAVASLVGTDPAPLLAGDVAPWDGVLLRADDLNALVDERDRLVAALDALTKGRGQDRAYADEALVACTQAVEVCRGNQPRTFLAGVGSGLGVCGAAAAAAVAGSR
jgi:hypothetical protein